MNQHGRTLVDCDCHARVHGDGSGIELDFCPLHEAAPALLKMLHRAMEAEDPDEWMADAGKLVQEIEG